MTRLLVLNDLHLEFGDIRLPLTKADVCMLTGDIHTWTNSVISADRIAKRLDMPVVLIAGNHEPYRNPKVRGRDLPATIQALRTRAAETEGRVTFLEKNTAVIKGVRFIGCTLRTNWNLFGDPEAAMEAARTTLEDFRGTTMTEPGVLYTPEHAREDHRKAVQFLEAELAMPHDGPTVVMTHHAPSARSISSEYKDDILSAGYASHLDELVARSGASLWAHGHLHNSSDYRIGGTRVICNPRGYSGYEINSDFDPALVVEV